MYIYIVVLQNEDILVLVLITAVSIWQVHSDRKIERKNVDNRIKMSKHRTMGEREKKRILSSCMDLTQIDVNVLVIESA